MDSMTYPPQCLDIFFLYLGSRTALANTNAPPDASGAGADSTTAATSVAEEIEQLKGQFLLLSCSVHGKSHVELAAEVLLLRKKANAVGHAPAQRAEITAIPKPRGEAGSKGFKLIREMGLDDTAEHKQLYRSIMVRQGAVNNQIVTVIFVILFCSGVSATASSNVPLTSLLTFVKLTPMT
jgi:hypothetical protein